MVQVRGAWREAEPRQEGHRHVLETPLDLQGLSAETHRFTPAGFRTSGRVAPRRRHTHLEQCPEEFEEHRHASAIGILVEDLEEERQHRHLGDVTRCLRGVTPLARDDRGRERDKDGTEEFRSTRSRRDLPTVN